MSIVNEKKIVEMFDYGEVVIIVEMSVCFLMNMVLFIGNFLVCLVVYKNF